MSKGVPQASLRAQWNDHCELRKRTKRAPCGTEPFRASIVPGGVYGGDGAIFAEENPIFQSKNRFLAVSAPENPQDFSGNW